MKLVIRNQAGIANKYIRFIKWKLRSLNDTFDRILYSEVFIKQEGTNPVYYHAAIRLGVPGPDLILTAKAKSLNALWSKMSKKTKRQLRKHINKTGI